MTLMTGLPSPPLISIFSGFQQSEQMAAKVAAVGVAAGPVSAAGNGEDIVRDEQKRVYC